MFPLIQVGAEDAPHPTAEDAPHPTAEDAPHPTGHMSSVLGSSNCMLSAHMYCFLWCRISLKERLPSKDRPLSKERPFLGPFLAFLQKERLPSKDRPPHAYAPNMHYFRNYLLMIVMRHAFLWSNVG